MLFNSNFMYQPKFSYSDQLVSNLIKLEGLKVSLSESDLSYSIKHKLTLKAKTSDIFHFSHLVGLDLTLKDSEKIANGLRLDNLSDVRNKLLNNFRNVIEFNRSNIADTYSELDFTVLLHINKLLLGNLKELWDSRFRGPSDTLTDDDKWVELVDKNISGDDIQKEMINLVEWYKSVQVTMPEVVRIAIVVYRLLESSPYLYANLYTSILVADYISNKKGYSSRIYSSLIKMFDSNQEQLLEAYKISRTNFDQSIWIELFSDLLIKEVGSVKENISDFIVEDEKSKNQPFLDMNKRQLKVLRYLQTVPFIKREDYCHMMEVSTMTAFRDLNSLVRKKLLKVDGQGRGTKYRLTSM